MFVLAAVVPVKVAFDTVTGTMTNAGKLSLTSESERLSFILVLKRFKWSNAELRTENAGKQFPDSNTAATKREMSGSGADLLSWMG